MRISILSAVLALVGLLLNDWLPSGILSDVGAVGNDDRRYLLRGLSILALTLSLGLFFFRRWFVANLAGIVLAAASTAICFTAFVAVDIYLSKRQLSARVASQTLNNVHQSDEHLGWRPRPSSRGKHAEAGSFDVEYLIDERGLKTIENAGTPRRRVYIFGDSYTFGHGVNNADTYANILAIEHFTPQVQVLNFGVMGYGIEQMFGRFLEIRDELRSGDVVVFAPTSQDIKRNLKDFTFPSKLIFAERVDFGNRYPYYRDGQLESRELMTAAYRFRAALFNGRWTKKIFRFLHSAAFSPDTTRESLAMIDAVSEQSAAQGAKFLLLFLPQVKECLAQAYEEFLEVFDYVDIMGYFPRDGESLRELRFPTDSHWNRAGHEIAAAAVAAELRKAGLIEAKFFR